MLSEDAAQRSVGSPDGRSIKIILISVYSTPGGRRRMKAGSPGATSRSSSPVASFTGLQTSPVKRVVEPGNGWSDGWGDGLNDGWKNRGEFVRRWGSVPCSEAAERRPGEARSRR